MLMKSFLATKWSSLIAGAPETTGLWIEWYEVAHLYGWLPGYVCGVTVWMFPYFEHIEKNEQGILSLL